MTGSQAQAPEQALDWKPVVQMWNWVRNIANLHASSAHPDSSQKFYVTDQVFRFLETDLQNAELYCFVEAALTKNSDHIRQKCKELEIRLNRDDEEEAVDYAGIDTLPLYLMETLRIEYINCINGIAFQNEQISNLMSQLREARDKLQVLQAKKDIINEIEGLGNYHDHLETNGSLIAILDEMRSVRIDIVNLKLDIEDRLNKRRMKEKRKITLADQLLKPLINDIEILAQVQSQAFRPHNLADAGLSSGSTASSQLYGEHESSHLKRRIRKPLAEQNVTLSQSNCRIYSDEEIRRALKRSD